MEIMKLLSSMLPSLKLFTGGGRHRRGDPGTCLWSPADRITVSTSDETTLSVYL